MAPPSTQPITNKILHARQLHECGGAMLVEATGAYAGLGANVHSVAAAEAAVNDLIELVAEVPSKIIPTLGDRTLVDSKSRFDIAYTEIAGSEQIDPYRIDVFEDADAFSYRTGKWDIVMAVERASRFRK